MMDMWPNYVMGTLYNQIVTRLCSWTMQPDKVGYVAIAN